MRLTLTCHLSAATDSASSVGDEISAAVEKLTGEAKTNGEVYINAVKKAAAKVGLWLYTLLYSATEVRIKAMQIPLMKAIQQKLPAITVRQVLSH